MGLILDYVADKLSQWVNGPDEADLDKVKSGDWIHSFHNYEDAKAYLMSLRYKYYDKTHEYKSWKKMIILQHALDHAKDTFGYQGFDTISKGEFGN